MLRTSGQLLISLVEACRGLTASQRLTLVTELDFTFVRTGEIIVVHDGGPPMGRRRGETKSVVFGYGQDDRDSKVVVSAVTTAGCVVVVVVLVVVVAV